MSATHDRERDATSVVSALAELQALTQAFSRSSTAMEFRVTLQVAFVADTACAWRLIETERSPRGCRRRMLCFESLQEMRRAIDEHLAWALADEQFRATQMATPGGFPGVTTDWVHTKDFDLMFAPSRHVLRKEMCATSPAHTLILRAC